MQLLLMLSLAWGRAASATSCADALLGRAAALEAGLLSLRDLPGASQLRARLDRQVDFIESAPRAAEAGLDRVERNLERMREFAATEGADRLSTYARFPEFLRADVAYQSTYGRRVIIEDAVLEELLEEPSLATVAVRALDRDSITPMRMDATVIEVRLLSSQYGNYRLYGVYENGTLVIKQLLAHHTRAHDIRDVVRSLR